MVIDMLAQSADSVGLLGVGLLLFAYFLLNTNKLTSQSLQYLWCNLSGAILILYSLLFHFNLASMVIEIAWITISVIGLYRHYANKKKIEPKQSNNVYHIKALKE
jgi:predicted membrane protein